MSWGAAGAARVKDTTLSPFANFHPPRPRPLSPLFAGPRRLRPRPCGPCLAATLQWRVTREGLPLLLGRPAQGRPGASPAPPPPLVIVGLSGGPASRALWALLAACAAGPAHDPASRPPPPRLRLVGVHVDDGVYGEEDGEEGAVADRRAALAAAFAAAVGDEVVVAGLEPAPSARPAVAALLAAAGPRGRPRLARALVRGAALLRTAARLRREEEEEGGGGVAVVALGTTTTAAAARAVSAAAAGCGLEVAAEAAAYDAGPPGLGNPLVAPILGLAARDCALHCALGGLGLPQDTPTTSGPPPPPPPPPGPRPRKPGSPLIS